MTNVLPLRIKTISEFHKLRGLPAPQHPLVSIINVDASLQPTPDNPVMLLCDFYCVSIKRAVNIKYKYGQQEYDFDEGVMFFMSPGQVFGIETNDKPASQSGWVLLVHPDFFWGTALAKNIKKYDYFDYAVHEALFLSAAEEITLIGILENIRREYLTSIDKFSQDIIISQLETLFNYAERYYHRQFITRKKANHEVLARLEQLLNNYFESDELAKSGLPTVQYISDKLNISPNYLRSLLKLLTGQSTQQHIHNKLIDVAKEKLSGTNLSVSEIAYGLGFEHPQSFSKLFRLKAKCSPLAFRQSFN